MDIAMKILTLLAGCGVFMMGLSQMSEGLERSAGRGMRRMFAKISNNRIAGYGIGAATTAVIQSSSATSVMTMGLANAGIVNLYQGSSIILGAKLGTTVTGLIIAFFTLESGSFSLGTVFAALSIVGILMSMISKNDKIKRFSLFLTGFGLLFLGLNVMSSAFGDTEFKMAFARLFENYFHNLFICLLVGLLLTCIIQSSSAASGIFLMMLGVGGGAEIITLQQAMFLMIGANIGTCITAILAAIGASQNAKRIAFFHVFSSVFGAIVIGVILTFTSKPLADFLLKSFGGDAKISLALFNVVYNLSYTLILLPFINPLVRLSKIIIRDKKDIKFKGVLQHIDERLLTTPTIAVAQVQKEILNMANRAKNNLEVSFKALKEGDASSAATVYKQEDSLNYLNKEIANYLIKLSSLSLSASDEKIVGSMHHVINDIERIGDHAKNFMEFAEDMLNRSLSFEPVCKQEAQAMYEKVMSMYKEAIYILEYRDAKRLSRISAYENEIDAMCKVYFSNHIERLHKGIETLEGGTYYYDFITELERVADHIVNIAFSIKNPIGTQINNNGGSKRIFARHKEGQP